MDEAKVSADRALRYSFKSSWVLQLLDQSVALRYESRLMNDCRGRPDQRGEAVRLRRVSSRLFLALGLGLAFLTAVCPMPAGAEPIAPDRTNIAYGADPQQTFDFWSPKLTQKPAPLLIFFHGGGFVKGDKHPAPWRMIQMMLNAGIAVVDADYRLAPGATYPAQMHDGARVIQYVRTHQGEFGIDGNRIALMGSSAGAVIALWLAFHSDLSKADAADPVERETTRVTAVVAEDAQATYDPAAISQKFHTNRVPWFLASLFGAPSPDALLDGKYHDDEVDSSPVTHMHAGEPPVLAFYSHDFADLQTDSAPPQFIHNIAQGRYLEEIARQKGAQFTLRTKEDYPNGTAGFLLETMEFLKHEFHLDSESGN